jgi:hypothetical protein
MIAERPQHEYALAMLEHREVEWAVQALRARAAQHGTGRAA